MSIFKTNKYINNHVKVDDLLIKDSRVSFKAKGIYMQYLALDKDKFDLYDIFHTFEQKEGLESLMSGIKELENFGYIEEIKCVGGIVYLIHDGYQNYKIGVSKNLMGRMISYNVAIPYLRLIVYKRFDNYLEVEKDIHQQYKNKRIKGEWFKLSDLEVEEVASLLGYTTFIGEDKQSALYRCSEEVMNDTL